MTLNPIDPKKKLLPQPPRIIKGGKHKPDSGVASPAKADSFETKLLRETRRIDTIRQDRVDEVKHKLLENAYESSAVLENLVERLIEVLK